MGYVPTGLGEAIYDRAPWNDPSGYPKCVTKIVRDAAHAACRPQVLKGLGVTFDPSKENPCWIETLPICAIRPPMLHAVPRPAPVAPPAIQAVPPKPPVAQRLPALVAAPPRMTVTAPPPPPVPARHPALVAAPPRMTVTAPPPLSPKLAAPPPAAPPPATPDGVPVQVAQAGFGTGGLLAVVAVIAAGGWWVFGRKKKRP